MSGRSLVVGWRNETIAQDAFECGMTLCHQCHMNTFVGGAPAKNSVNENTKVFYTRIKMSLLNKMHCRHFKLNFPSLFGIRSLALDVSL